MFYIMSLSLGNMWSNKPKNTYPRPAKRASNIMIINKEKISSTAGTKKHWGRPTWYLFHTIAARIHPEFYKHNYIYFWDFIKLCCANLPCPYCREHAMSHTNSIKLHQINTKEKLERVLFEFHNIANGHARNPRFNWSEISIYKRANINNIFNNFEIKFFRTYFGTREFSGWIRNKFKARFYDFRDKTQRYYI